MLDDQIPTLEDARKRLDLIIGKARVDMYKPIHIAEVLCHARMDSHIDIKQVETYRNKSAHWRNEVCIKILGKYPTSSQKYLDDIWNNNAMKPELLALLDEENKRVNGAVEKYIYLKFQERQAAVASIITLVQVADPQTFDVASLFTVFKTNTGLRRSIDKVYEVVVYSLMETIVVELGAQITVSVPKSSEGMLSEFSDLISILLGLSSERRQYTMPTHIYRVGVTNAADRGLDMWANFGPVIQVKHMTLDPKLAKKIVDQIESDNIIVICTTIDKKTLETVINQTSWRQRVRGIVTETQLIEWFERCLRGQYAHVLVRKLLDRLYSELKREFPQVVGIVDFLEERKYLEIESPDIWRVDLLQDLQDAGDGEEGNM